MISKLALAACCSSLIAAGLPLRVDANPCPNYPYPNTDPRCVEDGFCVHVEPEANAGGDRDRPGADKDEGLEPVTFLASAMAGAGTPVYSATGEGVAARGFVQSIVDAQGTAADATPLEDVSGRASTISTLRVTDLVFSGPDPSVETSLHLVLDASNDLVTTGAEADERNALTALLVGGGLCNPGQIVEFVGQRQLSLIDAVGSPPMLSVAGNTGILEDVPLDTTTELTVGPFTVPIGEAVQLEFFLQTTGGGVALGGTTSASHDYVLSLPQDGGPIFDLPPGFSADSPEANIVANAVPEPDPVLAAWVGFAVLLGSRLRRGAR